MESFEESDDDGSEYSEASEDSDSEGSILLYINILNKILIIIINFNK